MSINSNKSIISNYLKKILIIGNGGRENSLAWIIEKNELVQNIYIIPGNAGSEKINKCKRINFDIKNTKDLINKIHQLNIDLIVIGPEDPLSKGLGDILRENGFNVFGPGADGAKLESSKSWAKEFMKELDIPTAKFWKVKTIEQAKEIIFSFPKPLVVKADGLASGKGVFIPESKDECLKATKDILDGKFGESGQIVVLEEKIKGPEVSVFAICDGKNFLLLPTAQDHKRLNDNDEGPNTGGMGAYAPTPIISKSYLERITKEIIKPTINGLIKKNINYRGVLYFGLMITNSGPKVIEYNCRFGDPECQTIMPLMDKNFVTLLQKCAMGNLTGKEELNISKKVSGCVIATSRGYPFNYKTGYKIQFGNSNLENSQIFDSGTDFNKNGDVITNGGRVLSIVCQGTDFDDVFKKAYQNLKRINFEGIFYRNDIGYQVRTEYKKEK